MHCANSICETISWLHDLNHPRISGFTIMSNIFAGYSPIYVTSCNTNKADKLIN